MLAVRLALSTLIAYLLGSLVAGIVYSRWRGEDIRGRDLPGGSGTFRQYGRGAAVLVTLLDMLKGAAAVYLAHLLAPGWSQAGGLAVAAVVLGHCYPLFFRFAGGGGIAPLLGAMLVAAPRTTLLLLLFAALVMPLYRVTLQKRVGLNVIPFTTALTVPVGLLLAWRFGGFWELLAGGLAMALRAVHLLLLPKPSLPRPGPENGA